MDIKVCTFTLLLLLSSTVAWAHDESPRNGNASSGLTQTNAIIVQSKPGQNAWNNGEAPLEWWAEVKRQHGHVGPWNVLGWRIGQAALREFGTTWGRHDLEIICYVPPQTPFTCMVDGLSVGTGNSLGRLDLRLADVFEPQQAFVAVRLKQSTREVLEFRPQPAYLRSIVNQPLEKLEQLSRECVRLPEDHLFTIRRIPGQQTQGAQP
jgi:formylmethanofuran dehydrogenase subunit E